MSQIEVLQDKILAARDELGKVIVGQDPILEALFIALLSRGHTLLIGVPGLAKTLIVHSLAKVLGADYNRVQFTPDLMPSDITGVELIQEDPDSGRKEFRFVRGPVFCNILLADEINRTPPKTQSALLQAMQEHQVTQGDQTYSIDEPFFVLATQNPIEQEGTYPLPEAQLDRFTFSLVMEYPSFEDEQKIARVDHAFETDLAPCLSTIELMEAQRVVEVIPVGDEVVKTAVQINFATRKDSQWATPMVKKYVTWGSGPRASQFMIAAARARAFLNRKSSVSIEDISAVAPLVLQHRLVMNFQGEAEGIKIGDIIGDILERNC